MFMFALLRIKNPIAVDPSKTKLKFGKIENMPIIVEWRKEKQKSQWQNNLTWCHGKFPPIFHTMSLALFNWNCWCIELRRKSSRKFHVFFLISIDFSSKCFHSEIIQCHSVFFSSSFFPLFPSSASSLRTCIWYTDSSARYFFILSDSLTSLDFCSWKDK